MYGFLPLNKPAGISSFDCIRKLKRLIPKKTKIGHTGTLDEFAQGILIICIDRQATKYASKIMGVRKQYLVKAKLGEITDTLDCTGTVVETNDTLDVNRKDIVDAMVSIGSEYEQVPPAYSALKFKGQPLYKLAREKLMDPEKLEEIIQAKKRKVSIYEMTLTDFEPPFFSFSATVSKGTYIRSLANDIAQFLNVHATTYELTRSMVGDLTLDDTVKLSELTSSEDVEQYLLSLDQLLAKLGIQDFEN